MHALCSRPVSRLAAPMTINRPRRLRAARRGSETHFHPRRHGGA